jgi:hypothetical protein
MEPRNEGGHLGRLHFDAGRWLTLADEVVIERRWQRSPIIYGAPLDGRSRARLSRCDAGEGSTSWVSVSFTESSIRLVTAVAAVTTETAAAVKPAGQGSEALIARTERWERTGTGICTWRKLMTIKGW